MAEAHAKIKFSQVITVDYIEEAYRLHKEVLKQSPTDPLSGRIGNRTGRKRQKGKVRCVIRLFTEGKEHSNLMVTRVQFEDILKDLQGDGLIDATDKTSIRICSYKG
ncbi:hypothetical protein Trydic_g4416 [Trypoxylus dichotomus]